MKIFIHRNEQVYGPYSEISIHSFLKDGLASPTDWAWAKGRKQWVKLEDLLENGQDENPSILLSEKDHAKVKKIKELVEKKQTEFAYELTFGEQEQEIICGLLEGCKISSEFGIPELPDWLSDAQDFFINLLERVSPENEAQVDPSIRPSQIKKLCLSYCGDGLQNLNSIGACPKLESLERSNLYALENIEGIQICSHLTELKIKSCQGLNSMDSIQPVSECKNLKKLELTSLDCIESTGFLTPLIQLIELRISSSELKYLDGIGGLRKLEKLDLDGCGSLLQAEQIGNVTGLTQLNLENCEKIEDFSFLGKLQALDELDLIGCSALRELPALENLKDLSKLSLQGTSIPLEACIGLEESGRFTRLSLPDGSEIEKFSHEEDAGGVLPRIEFYLGGYGLEAHEGNITEAQYEYWKDKDENELIEHCDWGDENEDIPEDARLASWYEIDDISFNNGCQDGTLEVTEYRKLKEGWQKKYQTFRIAEGDSEDDNIQVNWVKTDRVAPTGPSFQGFSSEKGMYCCDLVEGKTFELSKLELFSESVFGGAQGDAISRIDYDGQELEFCPEADSKGYYFEILPSPEEESD
jgi:hypothetical protein